MLFLIYQKQFYSNLISVKVQACKPIFSSRSPISIKSDNVLILILYADDTAICRFRKYTQNCLNESQIYCRKRRLKLNYDKCKVIIFSYRKINTSKINISIEGQVLTLKDEYKYLGIIFSLNVRFTKAVNRLKNQAEKTLMPLSEI